jgi:hypothetical protein
MTPAAGDERDRHAALRLLTVAVQTSFPVAASSATRTASAAAKNTLLPNSATPRLVPCSSTTSSASGRLYRHRTAPLFASSAIT